MQRGEESDCRLIPLHHEARVRVGREITYPLGRPCGHETPLPNALILMTFFSGGGGGRWGHQTANTYIFQTRSGSASTATTMGRRQCRVRHDTAVSAASFLAAFPCLKKSRSGVSVRVVVEGQVEKTQRHRQRVNRVVRVRDCQGTEHRRHNPAARESKSGKGQNDWALDTAQDEHMQNVGPSRSSTGQRRA